MANVSSSNGLEKRPKLRFPGFDEPWRAEKLSDFAERVTRKNSNNETDLPLTISSKDGLVDQISYFNKTVASKDMSGYYLLRKGEYVGTVITAETNESELTEMMVGKKISLNINRSEPKNPKDRLVV